MSTDPWAILGAVAKIGDIFSRALPVRRKGRNTQRIEANPLKASWRELEPIDYGGLTWRPQIPEWGRLLGQEMCPEPSLDTQILDSLRVAGPFCPKCGTEMSASQWVVLWIGHRWSCDACRHATWMARSLADATATAERLVRARDAGRLRV